MTRRVCQCVGGRVNSPLIDFDRFKRVGLVESVFEQRQFFQKLFGRHRGRRARQTSRFSHKHKQHVGADEKSFDFDVALRPRQNRYCFEKRRNEVIIVQSIQSRCAEYVETLNTTRARV